MSANTTNQQITYPVGTDLADNPTAFLDMLADVEGRLVQRYTTDADRLARNPAPTTNELSIVTGNTWYDRWTGVKWLPVTAIQVFKTAAETVNNSTALQNDDQLFLPIPPIVANWTIEGALYYTSTTVADFKASFAANAGIGSLLFGLQGLAVASAAVTGDTNWDSQVPGTAIPIAGIGGTITANINGGFTSTGVAGTLQLQWAQNTLEATNTQVTTRSWLRMTAVS